MYPATFAALLCYPQILELAATLSLRFALAASQKILDLLFCGFYVSGQVSVVIGQVQHDIRVGEVCLECALDLPESVPLIELLLHSCCRFISFSAAALVGLLIVLGEYLQVDVSV